LHFDPEKPTETIEKITQKEALDYISLQEEALRFFEWFKVMSKMFVEA
jgi:CRISPR-associated protein Cmr5